MNCTQIDRFLDEMMDGTLSAEALNEVESHCQGCAACAEKLKVNRQMMRVFSEMAPEIDVPLEAQAAWRGAIRKEAKRKNLRRTVRLAGGIAAALVVVLGATFALRTPANDGAKMMTANMAAETYESADEALIEADGAAEVESLQMVSEAADAAEMFNDSDRLAGTPMHEIEMVVEDVDRVCDYAGDLAIEYEGTIEIQTFDEDGVPCANLYIDLPTANATEFVEALRHFDQSGIQPEALETDGDGDTSILLVLKSR